MQAVQHSAAMVSYYRYFLSQASEFGSHNSIRFISTTVYRLSYLCQFWMSAHCIHIQALFSTVYVSFSFIVLIRTVTFPNDILDRLK